MMLLRQHEEEQFLHHRHQEEHEDEKAFESKETTKSDFEETPTMRRWPSFYMDMPLFIPKSLRDTI